ncbi:MAG: starch synthase [Chlorobium phaeobacteroides]|uniref:Glycogen synthase n=1 Tax=Chlorobium phaeobacteroides (strain BS1) TaxID=331678 RepID=B3ENR2_CHLPB|nr:starch synthase [Chlorobium phaeobacteroides]
MSRSTCKVLYVSGEISPFVRVSCLADFMASFPQAMEDEGCEARIMMPKYGVINDRKFRLHDVLRLSDIEVPLKDKTDLLHVKVTALPSSKIQTYFLYNEKHNKRSGLFIDMSHGDEYKGSAERAIFFNLGILETLQRLGWKPDIIHFHDWYAGLVPLLLKTVYADNAFFKDIRTFLTVHNVHRQGVFPLKSFTKLLPEDLIEGLHVEDGNVNMLFTGMKHVDTVSTTSEKYAGLISSDSAVSCGADKVLNSRGMHPQGITNGLDSKQWNPSSDKLIKKKFDIERLDEKRENKKFLLESLIMPFDEETPLIGAMIHFDRFQGIDLLIESIDRLMELDLQLVICGSGSKEVQSKLHALAKEYEGRIGLDFEFTDAGFHQLMAAVDMLLIPGKSESCGMQQFFAMRYGAVPVVNAGGGISETIVEIDARSDGSGFVFHDYTPASLVEKIGEALAVYGDQERWETLVKENMERRLTWKKSAKKYNQLYSDLLERK